MHSIHKTFFLILSTESTGTLQESMRCPEKRKGPYFGIYLFEIYRPIISSYHIESIKEVIFV